MEYRNYYLPADFPVLVLTGGHWKISDIPSSRLHFHNCLEIGLCHSHSGTMKFYSEPMSFKEGDVTCIPRNIPHTTYSDQGTESRWSYIMFDPAQLFRGLFLTPDAGPRPVPVFLPELPAYPAPGDISSYPLSDCYPSSGKWRISSPITRYA